MKTINGKAIYSPKGKAGEYSKYACNFYVGCSNGCTYCYLRKGVLAHAMGGDTPTLKKCFRDENHALEVFKKELKANLPELQEHGMFFSFTTDPFLTETANLTMLAIRECHNNAVPVKILTKRGDNALIDYIKLWYDNGAINKNKIAFGFTLTGHNELEPNASTNAERIEAMCKLHEAGFKTWASIEPVIEFDSSFSMISQTAYCCDLYKIGLLSGRKYGNLTYPSNINAVKWFIDRTLQLIELKDSASKIYFKDSLLKAAGIRREDLPSNCVTKDYNIFNDK